MVVEPALKTGHHATWGQFHESARAVIFGLNLVKVKLKFIIKHLIDFRVTDSKSKRQPPITGQDLILGPITPDNATGPRQEFLVCTLVR
jgi:hypothetical protein